MYIYNPNTREVKAKGSEVEGHSQLHSKSWKSVWTETVSNKTPQIYYPQKGVKLHMPIRKANHGKSESVWRIRTNNTVLIQTDTVHNGPPGVSSRTGNRS